MSTTARQIDFLLTGYRHPTTDLPLNGGKVKTFLDKTSTLTSLWTDRDKTGTATNPVILDSSGKAEVFGDNIYKFEIYDSADNLLETVNGLDYIATSVDTVQQELFVDGVDYTAGTSTSITVATALSSSTQLFITFDGVAQHSSQFSVSGQVVTFTATIPASIGEIQVFIITNIQTPAGAVVSMNTVLYDTPGSHTYTKPSNLISAYVYASGGGAKGGDAPGVAAQFCAAGGGGAGGLARKLFQDADLAATTAVTIGAGGTSITFNGGQTDFGTHLTGNGGNYGNDGTSGTTASIERGGLAGLSSGGEFAGASEMGGNGKPGIALGGGDSLGGQGGASKFSEGGAVPNAGVAGGNGWPGYFGSGGGGAAAGSGGTSRTGGDGGDGVVYIIEYLGA